MMKRVLLPFLLLSLFALVPGCIAPTPPKAGKEVVRVSIQPVYSLHVLSQKYSPLVRYLARETEYDVWVASARSYENYPVILEANQVHIGIQNPLTYITLVKTRRAYPLVKMMHPDGTTSYRGVIITGQGSGIKRVEDLTGKKVAAASRSAVGGFLGQAMVCKRNGIDVDRDLYLSLVDSQDAVIHAVYRGRVAAGFVREDVLSLFRKRVGLPELNIIAYTDHFPTWCVAAFGNTPPEMAATITKALLKLDLKKPEDREILQTIGIAGFAPAADFDYDIMRQAMDALNIPY